MNHEANLVDDEEIDRFDQALQSYFNNEMDIDRFQSVRLQQGIYGQRQDGVNMVRIKVPGGRLLPAQLMTIAETLDKYAPEHKVHITTRQDIQMHYVPLQHTPAVLRHLAQAGLTTREACGNTVRNVTVCPLAGVCPREHVDVTPFSQGVVQHFLRHPLTQSLPRKFKISMSGCESDCAQGLIHDLGVVAVKADDGRFGFKILAGGGLGHKPHEAIVVEPFIEEADLLAVMEAMVVLHNKYSDRSKRAKSRIKFLVDRFGAEGFVARYREELVRTRAALAAHAYPKGQWQGGESSDIPGPGAPRRIFKQKQPNLYVFPVSVPLGDLDAEQLRGIVGLMRDLGLSDVRTTQDQNLILANVPELLLSAVSEGLGVLRLQAPRPGDDVVACPGTSTCRLGITSSMTVAPKLVGGKLDLRIRVSGCHNGCAQPETGDIGIFGEGRRMHGKLIPHYQMYFGGNGCGGGELAFKGPSVPAARIEKAVERLREVYANANEHREPYFHWVRKQESGYFDRLLADLTQVAEADLPQVIQDHGNGMDFKVLQLGGGECAGAVQDMVAAKFSEAAYERDCRNALAAQRKHEEAIDCIEAIAVLVGQALLFLSGLDYKVSELSAVAASLSNDNSLSTIFGKRFVVVVGELEKLRSEFNEAAFTNLTTELDVWVREAAQMCTNVDPQLDLVGTLSPRVQLRKDAFISTIDVSQHPCPINFIKAKLALDNVAVGDELTVKVASGRAARLVPESFESFGHTILSKQEDGDITVILVRKAEVKNLMKEGKSK